MNSYLKIEEVATDDDGNFEFSVNVRTFITADNKVYIGRIMDDENIVSAILFSDSEAELREMATLLIDGYLDY